MENYLFQQSGVVVVEQTQLLSPPVCDSAVLSFMLVCVPDVSFHTFWFRSHTCLLLCVCVCWCACECESWLLVSRPVRMWGGQLLPEGWERGGDRMGEKEGGMSGIPWEAHCGHLCVCFSAFHSPACHSSFNMFIFNIQGFHSVQRWNLLPLNN